ncbi:MAG: hypothetical protein HQL26_10275 [Candidatus Omnitrophica bacterium]|nr:hypothetical protein [Candidatus Omnitrophota bacterium]
MKPLIRYLKITFLASLMIMTFSAGRVFAQLTINILTVNGTDKQKDKDVNYILPKQLKAQDIIETDGLKLDYDAEAGAFYVHGSVSLAPKASKTYKVRIKDVWKMEPKDVQDVRAQIEEGYKRMQSTEFKDKSDPKKDNLLKRLDYITEQNKKFDDQPERRIEQYNLYVDELNKIRSEALSVKFWRAKDVTADQQGVIRLLAEVENPSKTLPRKTTHKHYLPAEVKPEHMIDMGDFAFRYDGARQQPYLEKEEELKPGEKKRYEFTILDVWKIPQIQIENLKDRTRNTYKLLEKTQYKATADFLVQSIKGNLELLELSQSKEKGIEEHISDFTFNKKLYEKAENDVTALEDLLEDLRKDLERSPMKNVLQKISSLKSMADISSALFGVKPEKKDIWKVLIGIIIFVGFLTAIYFLVWGQRSRAAKLKALSEQQEKSEAKKE